MGKLIILLMVIGLLIGGYLIVQPIACQAGFCMNKKCSNSSVCGDGCFCAKKNLEIWGICMSD